MAFNPSETTLFTLTYDQNGGDRESLCMYILNTEEVNCILLEDAYYMWKSHGSSLVVFDDYFVLSAVSNWDYYDNNNDDEDQTVSTFIINSTSLDYTQYRLSTLGNQYLLWDDYDDF